MLEMEPSKMGRIVAKNGVFSSGGTKMTDIAKFNLSNMDGQSNW